MQFVSLLNHSFLFMQDGNRQLFFSLLCKFLCVTEVGRSNKDFYYWKVLDLNFIYRLYFACT